MQVVPPPPPPPPPPSVARTVTLPAGTVIPIRMTDTLDSGKTQPNTVFHGSLAGDLIVDGMVVAQSGAAVTGRVITAKDATHFSGSSELSIELTRIDTVDHPVDVVTDAYTKQGAGRGRTRRLRPEAAPQLEPFSEAYWEAAKVQPLEPSAAAVWGQA